MKIKTGLIPVILALCIVCGCGKKQEPEFNENGKEEITLGVSFMSLSLGEIIVDYNKQSSRYEIVPVEFSSDLSFEDQRNRMQVELTDGKGPDIFNDTVLQGLDAKPFAEAGILMDVTDFLVEQGNICEKAAECNRVNGRLYGVPYSFSLNTMVTSRKLAPDRERWTKDYCMQITKECGATMFIGAPYGWSRESAGLYVLNVLGVGQDGIQLFVDEEKGISSFEQEEFIELLEFSKEYSDPALDESIDGLATGEAVVSTGGISNFDSFWMWDEMCGGEPAYIGFPSPEGGKHKLMVDSFYINAASSHKEGALDFLKYLLSEETQRKMASGGGRFAANENLLEAMWKEAKEEICDENTGYHRGGVSYEPRLMTDEEEIIFWDMLENAVYYKWENDIWDIVEEEAKPFFYGEKSAQEVAQIIDSRVQLYLDERK